MEPKLEPVKRVWTWYLVLVIIYYTLLLALQIAIWAGIDTDFITYNIISYAMAWGIFHACIFIVIINSTIEKKALIIPILAAAPVLAPFGGIFSPYDIVVLGFALYLLVRNYKFNHTAILK